MPQYIYHVGEQWFSVQLDDKNRPIGDGIHLETLAYLPYGSRVYGTHSKNSDWDSIKIVRGLDIEIESYGTSQFSEPGRPSEFNQRIMSIDKFQKKLDEHDVVALEAYFGVVDVHALQNIDVTFTLDLQLLRHSFSQKVSNSWVKAKKIFEVEVPKYGPNDLTRFNQIHRAKKSLFHSLRIIRFGIQIANHGKITDFSECNKIHDDIINDESSVWGHYDDKYRSIKNAYLTEFRELAPKIKT